MIMRAPQVILLFLYSLALGFTIARHGTPKGDHNLWAEIIAIVVNLSLLYWGGFFG
jgi:hypothetical protein